MPRAGVLLKIDNNGFEVYVWIKNDVFGSLFSTAVLTESQGFHQIKTNLLKTNSMPDERIQITNVWKNISVTDPRITFIFKPFGLSRHVPLSIPSYGTFNKK